jgi:hypothetical protein
MFPGIRKTIFKPALKNPDDLRLWVDWVSGDKQASDTKFQPPDLVPLCSAYTIPQKGCG